MEVYKRRAKVIGGGAILLVFVAQAFSSTFCYDHDLAGFFKLSAVFILPPLVPAMISFFSPNPLYAAGSVLCFLPWIILAFWVDCVLPYQGGGASMMYVAVLLWGIPSAIVGLFVTKLVLVGFKITVVNEPDS